MTFAMSTFWRSQEGLTSVEYALLLALLTIASVTAWSYLGHTTLSLTAESVAHWIRVVRD